MRQTVNDDLRKMQSSPYFNLAILTEFRVLFSYKHVLSNK